MHGEYKMLGGKLVVADLEIEDGRLSGVRISGDFFLAPDSALDRINSELEGTPLPLDADVLAQGLQQALERAYGEELLLYGVSTQAIVTAVQRALEDA